MQQSDYLPLVALWEPEDMITDFDYLKAVLERNPTTCYVIEESGQIVAAACGLYDGRRGMLNSVAVLPEKRGLGYGRMVVGAVVEALHQVGANRIRLFVQKKNLGVLPFYNQLGFEVLDDVVYLGLKQEARV